MYHNLQIFKEKLSRIALILVRRLFSVDKNVCYHLSLRLTFLVVVGRWSGVGGWWSGSMARGRWSGSESVVGSQGSVVGVEGRWLGVGVLCSFSHYDYDC